MVDYSSRSRYKIFLFKGSFLYQVIFTYIDENDQVSRSNKISYVSISLLIEFSWRPYSLREFKGSPQTP